MTELLLISLYLLVGTLVAIQVQRRTPKNDDDDTCAVGLVLMWGIAVPIVAVMGAEWILRRIAEGPKEDIGTAMVRLRRAALEHKEN